MLVSTVILPVAAVNEKDPSQPVTLDLSMIDAGTPVAGMKFSAYRVARVYVNVNYTVTVALDGDFVDYPVSVKGLKESDWPAAAETFAYYAKRDNLTPYDVTTTDADGVAHFPATRTKMDQGLYLIVGEETDVNGVTYSVKPFVVSLPSLAANGEDWVFDVDASVKFSKDVPPMGDSLDVMKIWVGDDLYAEFIRPESITVRLYDGDVEKSVVELSEDNNWAYTWENLGDGDWYVLEDPIDLYVMTVVREGDTFVITNAFSENEIPEDPIPREDLPQTGMVWWPVYALVLGGILLFGIGYLVYRKSEN